jgi:branched-chain amino acid transport system permease protein
MSGRAPRLLAVAGIALAIAILAVFPLVVTDPTATSIAVFTVIFMVAASSWNIFSGYSGYLALGHAVFFGCGGYTVALAAQDWHVAGGWAVFALLPVAGVVAGLIAIPVGLIALRTRRHTFVVVTIAIFFIFQLAAYNFSFTGGTSGLTLPFAPFPAATYNNPFYYVAAIILVATVIISWGVRRSRFGLQLLAVRDDEDRALGLGVKTRRVKLTAFVISAIPVGMVGGLYFYFLGQIFPQFAFDPLFDLSIALMAFFGGLGTLTGPLLGALVLESMQQYLTQTFSSSATYLIAYGVLFLAVILLLPRGIIPGVTELINKRRTRADRVHDEREATLRGRVPGAA